jgi:hypothetical protein
MKRLFISAVLVFGFIGAAMADSNPGPIPQGPPSVAAPNAPIVTAPADAAAASDDNTIVCHYERATGTLFQTRICHTNRQWKQKTEDAHNLMDKLQQDSAGQRNGGG